MVLANGEPVSDIGTQKVRLGIRDWLGLAGMGIVLVSAIIALKVSVSLNGVATEANRRAIERLDVKVDRVDDKVDDINKALRKLP